MCRHGLTAAAFRAARFPIMNIANKRVIKLREDSLAPYYVPLESPALAVVRLLESYSRITNIAAVAISPFFTFYRTRNFVTSR